MYKAAFSSHVRVISASTLAAAIHAAAFYSYSYPGTIPGTVEPQTPGNLNISFVLQPASVKQPLPQPEEPQQIKNVENQKPANQPTETVKDVVNQERPVKPKKEKQLVKQKTRNIAIQSARPEMQTPGSTSQPVIVIEDIPAVQKQQDLFINELLDQIEKNKFYPKKAKRRNIQGTVQVELKLDGTGNIVSLQLSEGHKILRKAAATAIQATAPFHAPPSSLTVPQAIKFGVQYQFR